MSSKLQYERLSSIPNSAKLLIQGAFPKQMQTQKSKIEDIIKKLLAEITAKRLVIYLIKKSKVPYALVWVDVIDEIAQIRFQFADGTQNMRIEKEMLLLIKNDLIAQKNGTTYTGYFLIDSEPSSESIIAELESQDIPAQKRVDLELILKKDLPILATKLDKPPGKFKSWNKKFLNDISDLDFRAFQESDDMRIMPDLVSSTRHKMFVKTIVQGEIGPLIKKASQVLYHDNQCIGALIATQLTHITALISILSIDPHYQKQGYGTYLLQYAIQKLWKAGIPRVLSSIATSNEGATHLAERFGFKEYQSHIDFRFT